MFEALHLSLHIQRWEQVPAEKLHTCHTSTTMEVICCEEVHSGATYGLFVASKLVDVEVDGEIYERLIRSVAWEKDTQSLILHHLLADDGFPPLRGASYQLPPIFAHRRLRGIPSKPSDLLKLSHWTQNLSAYPANIKILDWPSYLHQSKLNSVPLLAQSTPFLGPSVNIILVSQSTPFSVPQSTPFSVSHPTPFSVSYPTPFSVPQPTLAPFSVSHPTPFSPLHPTPFSVPHPTLFSVPSPNTSLSIQLTPQSTPNRHLIDTSYPNTALESPNRSCRLPSNEVGSTLYGGAGFSAGRA